MSDSEKEETAIMYRKQESQKANVDGSTISNELIDTHTPSNVDKDSEVDLENKKTEEDIEKFDLSGGLKQKDKTLEELMYPGDDFEKFGEVDKISKSSDSLKSKKILKRKVKNTVSDNATGQIETKEILKCSEADCKFRTRSQKLFERHIKSKYLSIKRNIK